MCVQVVDKSSEEAQVIQQYVKNTHAATHNTYTLEVEEVRGILQRRFFFLFTFLHTGISINIQCTANVEHTQIKYLRLSQHGNKYFHRSCFKEPFFLLSHHCVQTSSASLCYLFART